jgi:hypothetical protein
MTHKEEELERKKKYDEILEQYVRMIETGESKEEDNSTYIKRICESITSLGVAMCDFDESMIDNFIFVSHMFKHIHRTILEIIAQCYEEDPNGETEIGHFDVDDLKKWRKDNGIE